MNKIIKIVFALAITCSFVACNPIEKDFGVGDVVTSADQIQATVSPIVENGKNTNKVRLHCTSPVLCFWKNDVFQANSNDTTLLMTGTGNQKVTLKAMAADGKTYSKDYTVNIDIMKYALPAEFQCFYGSGSKTWVWAVDNNYTVPQRIWGNGGNGDKAPGWWGVNAGGTSGCNSPAQENIDINGTMTFSFDNGLKFSKTENGVTTTGTFIFNGAIHKMPQSVGQVTFSGTTIQHGISQNDGKKVVYVFDVIKITNDEMILMYPTDSNTYEGWFWVFKRQGFSY